MAITLYNIKKWCKMLTGTSVLHVNQDMGKMFKPGELEGYFNNMTEKVMKEPDLLQNDRLPQVVTEKGESIYFPVALFQYGLGAYDLYLSSKDSVYYRKFIQCCEWAIENQLPNGAWDNFSFAFPDYPYGAMCQGEAASLLVRAYKETGENRYLYASIKAIDYMITPVKNGGTLLINDNDYILLEYMHASPVLNGWIFAFFGLYDVLLLHENDQFKDIYGRTLDTLIRYMPQFDNGYWSLYNTTGAITSEFYHKLHIAQLQALYQITENEVFKTYYDKWTNDLNTKTRKIRAFLVKAIQKIMEK